MKKEKAIRIYTDWFKRHFGVVLPEEAPLYRMVEIIRRQHHQSVKDLIKQINGEKK